MRSARLRPAHAVLAVALGWSGAVSATPMQLSRTQFDALTAGNPTTQVEDFSLFTPGLTSNPLSLANGIVTFTASTPNIGMAFCTSGPCLAGNQGSGTRSFDAFPTGTRIWATDFGAFSAADTFDVTVVGGSGTLVLSGVVPGDFFGFLDPAGLTSVSFANTAASPSNYALDNVTTAVPEPSTALLLVTGLAALAASSYRRPGVRQRSTG